MSVFEVEEIREFLLAAEDLLLRIQYSALSQQEEAQGALLQLELLLRDVVLIQDSFPQPTADDEDIVQVIVEVAREVEQLVEESRLHNSHGRPRLLVSREELTFLLEYHYSNMTIARLLGVSPKTIRRRIVEYGLDEEASFTEISDDQLDAVTHRFVETHPSSGQRSIEGFLRGQGVKVQRCRVRESLMRVDPRGVKGRARQALHRRQYHVCMPNSLWHIDGYHKLIRWRIVIHGGVDGFSRLPVYMHASTNNMSDTVLQCFLGAVEQYGLPSRVRCDRGGENVLVSQFMLAHPLRGPGRGSCITGRSVHNQRIERFWRDLFMGCISLYYTLFYMLEDMGVLDFTNAADLFSLHYIFIPRINHALEVFRESYSHHRLRTARNCSPYQLWIAGIAERSGHGDISAVQGIMDAPLEDFGIDWDGPIPLGSNEEGLSVPITPLPLSAEQFFSLQQGINPLEEVDDYGILNYINARTFVRACI